MKMPKKKNNENCSICGLDVKDIVGHQRKMHENLRLHCIHPDCESNNYPTKNDLDLHIR